MNIAFISHECPPDTALGGIATYVLQAARALVARGNRVEVFAGSPTSAALQRIDGVTIHRIPSIDIENFSKVIGPVFAARHHEAPFDVLEGPEYNADAADAVQLVPEIPLVVKLHTPTYLLRQISAPPMGAIKRMRVRAGAWRRGQTLTDSPTHSSTVREMLHVLDADQIVSPSASLAAIVSRDWHIPLKNIDVIPYLFVPSSAYSEIGAGGDGRTVLFVGRLEIRKGVLDLVAAIPTVLRHVPSARFQFVGRSMAAPSPGIRMDDYLRNRLGEAAKSVEFVGGVPPERIPELIASAQICVFPSRWENFPTVCMEAMSAARAIIGTKGTGFAEQLNFGEAGELITPESPKQLAKAIVRLLRSSSECLRLGGLARQRVLATYSADAVLPLQEAGYSEAIKRRRALGPRSNASERLESGS
mgnify:CR=1 FL=1